MGKDQREKKQQAQDVSHQEAPALVLKSSVIHFDKILLLSLLTFLIYSNTFSASFHLDDNSSLVNNPWIKNLSNLLDLSGNRYVGYLSFALNYYFDQLDVFGYHLVNLIIHITNGFLVYLLIRLFFSTPRMQSSDLSSSQSSWIALATALLFVAHPIQTQAVTYIVQRFTSLATLFYLLAVVLYLQWRLAAPESRHRSLYYAGALLSTILAMKTKEITFTLPFMLLLIEAVFFGSLTRRQWIAQIPFLLTLLIIPLSHTGEIGEREGGLARQTTTISRMDYLFTQFNVLMTYLRLLILPVLQNLDYDYPISHSLLEPKVLFSFLFLLVLFTFSLYLLFIRPRAADSSRFSVAASRLVAFGILWFFLTLSIESSIIPIQDVIFEHRLYLPSVGFLLASSVMISTLLDRWRGLSTAVIGALVVILCVAAYQRNLVWRDDLTLWTDVVQKSPNKARVHNNLGGAYQALERFEEAIQEYETAITLRPNDAKDHYNLGTVYQDMGRLDEAIQEYKIAITLKPDYALAHHNLGKVYANLGHLDEAVLEYKTALILEPEYVLAHYNLGLAYFEQGNLPETLAEFEEAVKLQPDFTDVHYKLGVVYGKVGRFEEAIKEYKTAIKLNPDFVLAHNNLGTVYQDLGRLEEAIREFQIALKLKPDLVEAHYNLGQAYQRTGRTQEAIHEFEQALQIKPDYELARQALKSLRQ